MSYTEILNYLFEHHYQSKNRDFSSVTSSHWRNIGGQEVTRDENGEFQLHGFGFGHRKQNNLINRICYFPEVLMVNRMLSDFAQYAPAASAGRYIARQQSVLFGYDCARQILALGFILNQLPKKNCNRTCIIGDGFGYLGSLFKGMFADVQILSVNLGRTLLFDVAYTRKAFPEAQAELHKHQPDNQELSTHKDFVFLEAENYFLLEGLNIDLFINIASMHEMNLSVVRRYLELMRSTANRRPYFYCCNRIEKSLPDGEIISFEEYGWLDNDDVLCDELCPWYQRHPSSLPPFWRAFDGPIQHRLIRLAT